MIGARAIRVVKDEWIDQDAPVVLRLVPSEAIRSQTLGDCAHRKSPLRRVLDEELGGVEILDLSEALYVSRYVLEGRTSIIVSTIQAFRVANTDGRKLYEDNGSLLAFRIHPRRIQVDIAARLPAQSR